MFKPLAALAALATAALACGPISRTTAGDPAEALRGLPPRTDPPLSLDDDEDLGRAQTLFRTLQIAAPERAGRRQELYAAYQRRIDRSLKANRIDEAFGAFAAALGLWTPREIRDHSPDLAVAAITADALLQRYTRGGSAKETITLLAVQIAARPDRAETYKKQYGEIAAYLDDLDVAGHEEGARRATTIQALEQVVLAFPSPWAGETLVKLYLDRNDALQQAISSGNKNDPRLTSLTSHGPSIMRPVSNVIRVYALMQRIDEAKPVVEKMARNTFDEETVRGYLERTLAPGAAGVDWLRLAQIFLPNRDEFDQTDRWRIPFGLMTTLRICETAAARLPKASEPRTCAGAVAGDLKQIPLAIRWLEDARRLAPNDFEIADYLVRLYDRQLKDYMAAERIDAGKRALAHLERFHAEVKRRFPKKTVTVQLSDAYLTLAQGLFNVGEVSQAVTIWKKALAGGARIEALEQLAMVDLKRGNLDEAARGFEQAAALPRETPLQQHFDRARLLRLAGEAHQAAGRDKRAREVWAASLLDWNELAKSSEQLSSFQNSQVRLGRARVLFYLGNERQAIRNLEMAIDLDKEESTTYADAISFLLTRGRFEPALDAYLRALGRVEIIEYFKVYTSLWIIDFARLRKLQPNPLAVDYLATREGTRWYHELARYRSGKIDYAQLLARADTRGKRAEAYFYEAMARFAAGKDDEAEELLRLVLATDMLGFFEFDMARYFLEHGPPR